MARATGAARRLAKTSQAEFAWTDFTLALAEKLFAALPALHGVRAEISDGALDEIAKAGLITRFERLSSTHSRGFDRGLKALAKRKGAARSELGAAILVDELRARPDLVALVVES